MKPLALLLTLLLGAAAGAQTLRVGWGADRYSKAEHYLTFAKGGPNAWITEPLVFHGDDFTPQPGLLERWERLGDGLFRLFVRPGIVFQNGAALDAEAVRLALVRNAMNRSENLLIDSTSYRVVDDHTLELRTRHRSVHFVGLLGHPYVAAYAPGTDPVNAPVGTGPFVFEDYRRDQYLKVRRNPDYWRTPPPNEHVVYRFLPDPQARLLALQAGEVDLIHPVDMQMLQALPADDPDVQLIASQPNSYVALSLNIHGEAPFDRLRDVRLRRALAWAIDRAAIAEVAYLGHARPATTLLAARFWGVGQDFMPGYGYDPARAAALLDSAGWRLGADGVRSRDGRPLRLRLVAGWPAASQLAPIPELLQQMWRAVGVDVELVLTDDDGVYYGTYFSQGRGDLFLERGTNTGATPAFLLGLLFHSDAPWAKSGYRWSQPGAAFDAQIDSVRLTTDAAAVRRHLRQAQVELIQRTCAVIPIVHAASLYLTRPGVEFDPDQGDNYARVGYARLP